MVVDKSKVYSYLFEKKDKLYNFITGYLMHEMDSHGEDRGLLKSLAKKRFLRRQPQSSLTTCLTIFFMEKQPKQKMKDMPAQGKRGGNWHFRQAKRKDKFKMGQGFGNK